MARPDAATEQRIARFAEEIQAALDASLTCLALYGSAVGDDWVPARSDLNTVLVVDRATCEVLDRLAPVVARWRGRGFSPPVVMDAEYLAGARDTFPMELADIQIRHRLLAGRDVFAELVLERAALRRECEREARGKLLRLRAFYLETAGDPTGLERLMLDSLKSFLAVLHHLCRLRGVETGAGHAATLAGGEAQVGPLPAMRALLARRTGDGPRPDFGAYLAEVERIVAAVDRLDA